MGVSDFTDFIQRNGQCLYYLEDDLKAGELDYKEGYDDSDFDKDFTEADAFIDGVKNVDCSCGWEGIWLVQVPGTFSREEIATKVPTWFAQWPKFAADYDNNISTFTVTNGKSKKSYNVWESEWQQSCIWKPSTKVQLTGRKVIPRKDDPKEPWYVVFDATRYRLFVEQSLEPQSVPDLVYARMIENCEELHDRYEALIKKFWGPDFKTRCYNFIFNGYPDADA